MTFRELFEKAEAKGWMDKEIAVQYRDEGGEYYGCDENIYLIEEKYKDGTSAILL